MKCLTWASLKTLKLSLAEYQKNVKLSFSQQLCLMPSNVLVCSSWKTLSMWKSRLKNWPMLTLTNTLSEWRNKRSLIPWLALWMLTNQNCQLSLVVPNVVWTSWHVAWNFVVSVQRVSTVTLTKTNVFVLSVTSRTTKSISWLRQTLRRVVLIFQVSLTSTTMIFHKIQKATFTVLDVQDVQANQVNLLLS